MELCYEFGKSGVTDSEKVYCSKKSAHKRNEKINQVLSGKQRSRKGSWFYIFNPGFLSTEEIQRNIVFAE